MSERFGTNEVSEKTGISPDLIRKYCRFFNIEVERKQLEGGKMGRRMFSQENIDELIHIKESTKNGVTWENILAAKNGDKVIVPKKENLSLEEDLKSLKEEIKNLKEENKEQKEKQDEINRLMLERFTEMSKQFQLVLQEKESLQKENVELKEKPLQIEYKKEEENEEPKVEKKKKSFWARFFS